MSRFGFDSYKFTDVGRRETVNSLESEQQDLELNSLNMLLCLRRLFAVTVVLYV